MSTTFCVCFLYRELFKACRSLIEPEKPLSCLCLHHCIPAHHEQHQPGMYICSTLNEMPWHTDVLLPPRTVTLQWVLQDLSLSPQAHSSGGCTSTLLWLCQMWHILLPAPTSAQNHWALPVGAATNTAGISKNQWDCEKEEKHQKLCEMSVLCCHLCCQERGKEMEGLNEGIELNGLIYPKKPPPSAEWKKQEDFSFLWISSYCGLNLPEINQMKFGLLVPLQAFSTAIFNFFVCLFLLR